MKIYGTKQFGNPRRVAIFLAEKGVDVPFESVDLMKGEHKTPEFLAKNPAAQVPVLELDDGTCIAETIAICRYLEALHPEPPLFGTDPLGSAIVEMWQRRVEFKLYTPAREAVRHTSSFASALEPVQISEWGQLNRGRALEGMRMLDAQLAKSEFIAGPRYSVADITAIFTLQGLAAMAGLEIPEDCPNLQRWFDQVARRPATKSTLPPRG